MKLFDLFVLVFSNFHLIEIKGIKIKCIWARAQAALCVLWQILKIMPKNNFIVKYM